MLRVASEREEAVCTQALLCSFASSLFAGLVLAGGGAARCSGYLENGWLEPQPALKGAAFSVVSSAASVSGAAGGDSHA